MPIYAYKCGSCGHSKDVLQKISDPLLTVCPACGADTFSKQVTAAGFQLKGSGWYVTDFRGGNSAAPAADGKSDGPPDTKTDSKTEAKTETKTDTKAKTDTKPADGASSSKSETAPSARGGRGPSRGCH
jgi:putative FmdB family regulatory protein